MSKTVTSVIKLLVPAGAAKPAPPVGPALGQHGLNIMAFCKEFNAKTAEYKNNVPVPVIITGFADKSFVFTLKSPPTTYFVKKAAGILKGTERPGILMVGSVTLKHIYEIAKIKKSDPGQGFASLESHCKNIIGTCRTLGVTVMTKAEMDAMAAEAITAEQAASVSP
mmetsp:Transcript_44603/g.74417  ORF Transcript_44603/g.74417 Transcript_44603/m.74417 type:complete len:167 (+) Transcript_44603:241-741(+)